MDNEKKIPDEYKKDEEKEKEKKVPDSEENQDENKDKEEKGKTDKTDNKTEDSSKEDEKASKDDEEEDKKKKKTEFSQEDEDKATEYSLEDIPEYVDLKTKYSTLESQFNDLKTQADSWNSQLKELQNFKLQADKKEKEAMINSFYMLSDEDKKEVVDNIDTYSLDDIEAKLSIICVRNKVNFNLDDEDEDKKDTEPTTYNLNNGETQDETVPAWVRAAVAVQ